MMVMVVVMVVVMVMIMKQWKGIVHTSTASRHHRMACPRSITRASLQHPLSISTVAGWQVK